MTYDAHDLLVARTRDALGNTRRQRRTTIYRVLQPRLVTDPNRNRPRVAFDALGMVVGTAVMGKARRRPRRSAGRLRRRPDRWRSCKTFVADPRPMPQAILLGKATTRIVYDLDALPRATASRP